MILNTTNFGELTILAEKIIKVEGGLLGFEEYTDYMLINNTDTEGEVPFCWIQSCKNPNLALVLTVPFLVDPGYEVDIPEDILHVLDVQDEKDVAIYSICKIPEKFEEMTINLKSPLIVNIQNNKAIQMVMHDSSYRVDEPAVKKI